MLEKKTPDKQSRTNVVKEGVWWGGYERE
jgi:hypothetical protein